LKITILGTSAGIPTKNRNVSAVAVQFQNEREWSLFDCGESTQKQIMKTPLSIFKLKNIFITHLHGDHIYGIFGLLASRGLQKADSPLNVFGPKGLKEMLQTVMRLSGLNLPFELNIVEIEREEVLVFKNYELFAVRLSHSITTFGYVIKEREKEGRFMVEKARKMGLPEGPLYGKLKRKERVVLMDGTILDGDGFVAPPKPGKTVIIGGDNDDPLLFLPFKNPDLMIHEATYTSRDFEKLQKKYRHTTALQLGIAASEISPKKLILTHISPRYESEKDVEELLKEVKLNFDGDVEVAYDLMQIEI